MILDELLEDVPDHGVSDGTVRFLDRIATRIRWRNDPEVRLRYLAGDDALIVEVLPLPPAADRIIDGRLCIEFDGNDAEALPTAFCLTGFRADGDSLAERTAKHLLGETLWTAAQELASSGVDGESALELPSAVRDSRVNVWRRLAGLGLGVEIQPERLRAVLTGPDTEAIAELSRPMTEHTQAAVVEAIASLVTELLGQQATTVAGAPVVIGLEIAGPVSPVTGLVHHFNKRGRAGEPGWGWADVPLADLVRNTTKMGTYVLNDVVAYATYERWIHPSPTESLRGVLLISQGIGAKVIRNGQVDLRRPMELGSMVLHPDGEEGDNGTRGCVEATAGTLAMLERIQRIVGYPVEDMRHAVDLAEADGADVNEEIINVFRAAGNELGRVIGNQQAADDLSSWAIYGPEPMLTKGSEAGQAFLANLQGFPHWVAYKPYQECEIRPRPIVGTEGPQGAALAALEHFGLARCEPHARGISEDG